MVTVAESKLYGFSRWRELDALIERRLRRGNFDSPPGLNMEMMMKKPLTPEQAREIQRALHRLAEPFVQAKCDVLAVSLPTYRFVDGKMETIYAEDVIGKLAALDALWKEASDSFLAGIDRVIEGLKGRAGLLN